MSDQFIIHKTESTSYHKVAWNINFIKNHPKKIKNSILFFGPSLVQGGICDSSLNAAGIKSYNLGVNHFGNDLSLFFLNKVKNLAPKAVIFHKKKTPNTNIHKLTPLLYSPSNLLFDGQAPNIYFIKYLFKRTALIIEYLYFSISENTDSNSNSHLEHFGVRYEKAASFDILKPTKRDRAEMVNLYLNDFLYQSEKGNGSPVLKLKVLSRKWNHFFTHKLPVHNARSQNNFIETAHQICRDKNITFSEIYMPETGDVKNFDDYNKTFYMKSKTDTNIICLTDFSFLNKPYYWADMLHLNKRGTLLFTQELMDDLKALSK